MKGKLYFEGPFAHPPIDALVEMAPIEIDFGPIHCDEEMMRAFLAGEVSITFCNSCYSTACPSLKDAAAMCPGPAP